METFFDLNWAEIFGFVGLLISITAHQIKQPKIALYALCLASASWSGHFYLLGETAYMIALLNVFRNMFAAKLKPEHVVLAIGLYLSISYGFILAQSNELKDLLPLVPVSLIAAGILQKSKPHRFRACYLTGESMWLVYGILVGSFSFVLSTAFVVGSIALSIYRHDLRQKLGTFPIRGMLSFNSYFGQKQQPVMSPVETDVENA